MENERDFKGIWIPKEVWLDERLNALDKVILMEIDSLDNGEKGCFASNKYIANFCICSETKVSTAISKLIYYGYITSKNFDGRHRELKSSLSKFERQTIKICKADYQNLKHSNIDNKQGNSLDNINNMFDEFWDAYPKKVGKKAAQKAFAKVKEKDLPLLIPALEKQKLSKQWTKDNGRYIPNASTWLNGERWNDELQSAHLDFMDFV